MVREESYQVVMVRGLVSATVQAAEVANWSLMVAS
jgi:hypothetical protein